MSFNVAITCVIVFAFVLGAVGFSLTRKPGKQN